MKKRLKKSIYTVQNVSNPNENIPAISIEDNQLSITEITEDSSIDVDTINKENTRNERGDSIKNEDALIRNVINDEEIDTFDDSSESLVRLLDEMDTGFREPPKLPELPPAPEPGTRPFQKWDFDRLYEAFTGQKPLPEVAPGIPDSLPIDHHLPELLKRLTNESDLNKVTRIKLKIVSLEMSLARVAIFLPNLKELDLEGSCLLSLRDLGVDFSCLSILNVSNCGLHSLDGTYGLENVTELYASDNMIGDIGCAAPLINLVVLDLSRNQIKSIYSAVFLRACKKLRNLKLEGNPCSSEATYIDQIQGMLPQLTIIDNKKVRAPDHGEDLKTILRPPPLFEKKSSSYKSNVTCKARRDTEEKFKKLLISSSEESDDEYQKLRIKTQRVFEEINYEAASIMERINQSVSEDRSPSTSSASMPINQVLCGNLTQALTRASRAPQKKEKDLYLRREKKRIDDKKEKTQIVDTSSDEEENPGRSVRRKRPLNLIDASKHFRDKYQEYREKNRTKWKEEEKEDVLEGDTESS